MKYILALLVSVSVMAAEIPTTPSTSYIDPASIVPDGYVYSGAFGGSGIPFECNVGVGTVGASLYLVSVVSSNGAAIAMGLKQVEPFGFTLNYGASSQIGATDTITFGFAAASGGLVIASKILTFSTVNTPPSISISASPSMGAVGFSTSFLPIVFDADGQSTSLVIDYGDGVSGSELQHTYLAEGVYAISATVTDASGASTVAKTSIVVVGSSHIPKARIQTSDIVAFVNVPFTVDGTASTDEQNQPLSFLWNFGDDSPLGSGSVLSHLFTVEGARAVSLTVTDSEGFTNTTTIEIEVLSEQSAATFDSEIRVTSTYFPQKQNRDIVQVFARVNIGDAKLADGAAVALEYAGKRYATTLNKRLKSVGWTVKQSLRRQPFGTVEVNFKARNTAIASLLSGLGALNDTEIDVPFRLELGAKTIVIDVPTLFDVGLTRGKGLGELD